MSFEKEVREVLGEAAVNYKKLDQLVRQGMMSPAALPILHRGLDKMQAGQVLNPQEREAVNKVMQSMLYIVTGDDTVFQKARQHTQRTKYQTEEVDQLDEYGNYQVNVKGSGGTTVKARSDKEASQKAFKTMGIADRHRKNVPHSITKMKESEEYDNEGEMAKSQLTTLADAAQELMGMLSDDQNLPEWVQSKITKAVDYLDTARDYMKSEGDNGKAPVGEEVMSESYKEKFAAALKKSGKSLAQMSDEEKKKFFNDVDASHKAKNEEAVDEGAMSRMATQASEKERLGANKVKGSGLETFKKKPAAKDTLVASPKTQRVKRTTAAAAKRMVSKGAVYAEEVELLDEGDYAVVSTNGSMVTNKSKVHGYVKSMPKGKNLDKLLDKHGADRVIHKDKLKSSNVSEDTVDEGVGVRSAGSQAAHDDIQRMMNRNREREQAKKKEAPHNTSATQGKMMSPKGTMYGEDAASDQEEIRAKTQSKLARMSKMKAKQEKETDPGIKEDLVSENYGATQNAMAHAKKDGANYKDQSVAHKYNALHMKKAGYTHFKNTRMGGREYNKTGVGTKIEPHHHQGLKEDTFDEASAYADARRAMKADSKGMAPTKKAGGTKTYKGTKAGEERHGGHIVMQLRKAVSIGKPVKFKDGKEHKVSKADAHKFLSKYNSSKPADREKMHSGHDNHDTFQSHINK